MQGERVWICLGDSPYGELAAGAGGLASALGLQGFKLINARAGSGNERVFVGLNDSLWEPAAKATIGD